MKISKVVLFFLFSTIASAQNLTISSSGQTGTSGTNWSISGNTLNVAASGSANIHPNVISNHLNSVGNLTVVLPFQSGVARQCSIDGTITYTGSATRTLTFSIGNDIFMTSANQSVTATGSGALNVVLRAAYSGGVSPDNGRISIRQNNTINTNGGHLWIGGGSVDVAWNGLTVGNHFARTWSDDVPGLWIENSTLNTNGGNVYLAGLSHNSSANSGLNYGVHLNNTDISSVSGNIEINGELRGRYHVGNGTRIESTTTATSITTTTGSITISGKGYDNDPNDNGNRFGAVITGLSSTIKTIISSTSGNIQIEGNAYFTATVNDKEGLGIGGATEIISRSGNITIRGTNTLETSGHYCNSIRFNPRNESNSIRVGFDGTNSYTGNILIEGNSIYQRYLHSSAGSIAVQTTGTLTIQPTGTAFTYMRANDPGGTLTYDNDWNFGTNLGGFVYGKTTNTSALTYNNSLRTNGPMTFYTGSTQLGVGVEMTADGANGHINFLSSNGFGTVANSGNTRGKIMATGGGSININADSDNNNSGTLDIDWLTIDGTSGNVLLECAAFNWNTGSQVALPEFYSNGGALTIRNTTSSNHDIRTDWFAMFGTFGGVTLGREGGTGAISLNSCTNCSSSALNFGTSAFQVAGPITALGGNIYANINLRSTNSGSDILLKADKHIVVGANVGVQSNNGDITFWSNSNGVADATDGDFIGIQNAVVINSADGSTTQTTGGGTITLAGGNTSEVLPSGTVVPTAYAYSSRTTNWGPLLPPGGVNFGFSTAANGQVNSLSIYSGGGNIVIKGKSHSSSAGIQWFSGSAGATQIINSGVGTILFDGLATSTNAHGIEFMSYASVVSPTIISSNTSSAAISIKGETYSTNLRSGYQGTVKLEANGIGGGIQVYGIVPSSSNYGAIEAGTLNAYALSGPITFISEGGLGLKAGGTWGKGTLPSSSSNITLRSDKISLYAATIESTGTLTVEPLGTSFASALTFPITNLTVGNTVSGLTLGKSTNTANITFANATTIAGPITAYGGNMFLNDNLTTTGTGTDVLIKGTSNINLAASKTITTAAGDVNLWADSDDNATGYVQLLSSAAINSTGGDINLGGGANLTSDYAFGTTAETCPEVVGTQYISGVHMRLGSSLTSSGGNISLRGQNANTANAAMSFGVSLRGVSMNSGTGKISLNGVASGSGSVNGQGVASWGTLTLRSANTTADAISIIGDASAVNAGVSSLGVNMVALFEATGTGGGITINGKAGTATEVIGVGIGGAVLAASGPITIIGESTNNVQPINFGSGMIIGKKASTNVLTSSSNVILEANAITTAGTTIDSSGALTVRSTSTSFPSSFTWPLTNVTHAASLSGLTIGKTTNTANVTFANATSIAGPITAYGGTITLDANLTTTNNGSVSLYTDNPLGGLTTARTLTASGAFKYIPRGTSFAAAVTYPITNLTSTSAGLTIGKTTNDKNITINADVTGAAGIELYGNNVNINANLKTTSGGAMYLKGITTIAAGKYIESNGDFTHDGNLNFKSDATGTAAFGALGGTFTRVSGLATVERYIPAKRAWRLLTAPLKGASNTTVPNQWQGVNGEGLLLFSPATYQSQTMTGYTLGGGMPNIWKYNNGWQTIPNLTNENLFTATGTKGFLVFATGASDSNNTASGEAATTLKPQGQLITGEVLNSIIGNQYNLVPNPYASALNTEAMVQANSGSKVWMVDPSLGTIGGYFTYDGSNWAPTTPSTTDKNIQSGQAFFVRTLSNSTFTISESNKILSSSTTWFSRTLDTSADKIRVLLYKQNNLEWQLADGILAVNSASGNNDVDDTDTGKMSNFNENILFRNGSSNLAIEYRGLPSADTTQPIRLTGTTVLPYQLRVKTESYTNADLLPFIEDTTTGITTPIPTDGTILTLPFTGIATTSTTPDQRFKIVYQSTTLNTDDFSSSWASVYPNPVTNNVVNIQLNTVNENTDFTLTNLLGQIVHKGKLNDIQNTITLPELQAGMYMITINQEDKKYTTKLYIK